MNHKKRSSESYYVSYKEVFFLVIWIASFDAKNTGNSATRAKVAEAWNLHMDMFGQFE